jgi:hypothetical protein
MLYFYPQQKPIYYFVSIMAIAVLAAIVDAILSVGSWLANVTALFRFINGSVQQDYLTFFNSDC